jgi:membrane protease YdiL (CAAX protease family)
MTEVGGSGHDSFSAWSYAYLAFLLLVFPYLVGRGDRSRRALAAPRIVLYISSSVTLWLLVGGVAGVLALEGSPFWSLGFGATGQSRLLVVAATLVGVGLGIGLLCRWLQRMSGTPLSPTLRHGIPGTAAETAAFCLLLAPSAGIAEEILFRGFAITRLQAVTHSAWVAVIIASTAFALAHLYQGWVGPVRTGLGGLVFGAGFIATGSLLPSIFAHTTLNVLSAVLFRPPEAPPNNPLQPPAGDTCAV